MAAAIEEYEGGYEPVAEVTTIGTISAALERFRNVYDASRTGDLQLLRELVEVEGCDINEMDMFDATPLYYACLCGHVPCVRYLLDRGAHCEVDTFDGERCHYAALSDDIRKILKQYEAANRQRGPLYAFTFRILDNENALPDVTFCLARENFAIDAHKFILAARSPWFRRQFGPGGRWCRRRYIHLTSKAMSGTALRAVIGYMYTDRLLCPRYAVWEVSQVAKACGLRNLSEWLASFRSEGDNPSHAIAVNLGLEYTVGSVPAGTTGSGLREDLWNEVVKPGAFSPVDQEAGDVGFLRNGVPFDLRIVVDGMVLRGHRAVVATRCPYFAAMLHFHDQGSTTVATLPLADFSLETCTLIVEFLYCDTIRLLSSANSIIEALMACDMLGLTATLRAGLISQAIAAVTTASIYDFFRVADLYDLRRLSTCCARYIAISLDAVLLDDEFSELVRESAQSIQKRHLFDSIPVVDDIVSAIKAIHAPEKSLNVFDGSDRSLDRMLAERVRKLCVLQEFARTLGYSINISQDT